MSYELYNINHQPRVSLVRRLVRRSESEGGSRKHRLSAGLSGVAKAKAEAASIERGFTIAELLIALAITSILLAAVAVAFKASIENYRENEDIFKTVNNARQALLRMTSQIRTGDNFNPGDPANRCSFFTANNEDITYEYRNTDNRLYLITNSDSSEYVLCNNVTSMSFIKNPTQNGTDVKSVQISMTVASGDTQRTVSAAAVVRKNLD